MMIWRWWGWIVVIGMGRWRASEALRRWIGGFESWEWTMGIFEITEIFLIIDLEGGTNLAALFGRIAKGASDGWPQMTRRYQTKAPISNNACIELVDVKMMTSDSRQRAGQLDILWRLQIRIQLIEKVHIWTFISPTQLMNRLNFSCKLRFTSSTILF